MRARAFSRLRGLAAAVVAGSLLAGCATPGPQAVDQAAAQDRWRQRQPQLASVTGFRLQGRISTGALFGASGSLSWQQQQDAFEALFSGALGVGAVKVTGTADDLVVQTRDGSVDKQRAEALLQQRFGWTPPWRSLRYWILGMPRPDAPATVQLDADGRLRSLNQDGWQLDYQEYRATPAFPVDLPRKLELQHGDETIHVLVDVWQQIDRR